MLMHLLVLALTVLGLSWVVPGFHIRTAGTAIAVAIVFSVLNFFLGFVVGAMIRVLIFLPAILTLGLLFALVPFLVNTVLLWLTDKVMGSFEIESTGGLLVSAAVITFVNSAFYAHHFNSVLHGNYRYESPNWV
jgi:putative membrane protein